jgi:hypothetical protein
MSRNSSGKHWYQVHKSNAGDESVSRSEAVKGAKGLVRTLEIEAQQLKATVSESLGANLRRLVFGRNPKETQLQQLMARLEDARRAASMAEIEARKAGERAYGSDWAERNPEKVRKR